MTTYLGKSCSFCLPRVPFVGCRQFVCLVISLLVLMAGYGIWLYQFLIIAYLFTFHPRVLKELATELGPVFAYLFQQSVDTGEIPKEWSLANNCPLFKKSDRSLACNYRPVSLTCVPCKLLEHIVCPNIMSHLDEHKLLSDRQHAFRKGHSCETQLTTVINDWAKILDNRGQVDTFILDFEKAFDTPPHELLKSKLFSYWIGGKTLKWIDSFLCFRQQRVVVNGVNSDWAPVLSGVPQGTVPGPLLFSLYINDISSDIESEIILFADGCVYYRKIKNEEDTMKLQSDIDRLGSWARKWGMRFQPVKCNMMQLTRTDQEDPCFIYLRGNWPWKRWKHFIPWSNNYKWFEMEYTCKQRLH